MFSFSQVQNGDVCTKKKPDSITNGTDRGKHVNATIEEKRFINFHNAADVMNKMAESEQDRGASIKEIELQNNKKMFPRYEKINCALQALQNQPLYQSPGFSSRVSKASTRCPSSPSPAPSAQL